MSNHPFRSSIRTHHNEVERQETLDDVERVLPKQREEVLDHTKVKPRKLDALRLFEKLQERRLLASEIE